MLPARSLTADEWSAHQAHHFDIISPFTANFRSWRGVGNLHPVYDFLFTYYTYSTVKLEQWHPGFAICIEPPSEQVALSFLKSPLYRRSGMGVGVFADTLRPRELRQLEWVRALCETLLARKERYSCFGLHEWTMLCGNESVRHQYPLRLPQPEIEEVVRSISYCCSHYDAVRFSSPCTRKLNVLQPGPNDRLDFEQGGCIHANMDLYKWAFKLSPLISSDLVRASFLLALRAREVDMRASPYDLTSIGFPAIRIETPEGRLEYQQLQREIAADARKLRAFLLQQCVSILEQLPAVGPEHAPPASAIVPTTI